MLQSERASLSVRCVNLQAFTFFGLGVNRQPCSCILYLGEGSLCSVCLQKKVAFFVSYRHFVQTNCQDLPNFFETIDLALKVRGHEDNMD